MPMPTLDRRLLIAVAVTAMLASGLASAAPARTAADKAYAWVDPFIGTGGEGHTYPGATVPFGMVQLSPDTRMQPREKAYGWAAGYRYDDSSIVGFSHTHFSGTGHSDLGDILLMPFTGSPGLERGDPEKPRSGYASRFRHDDEKAEPGYYAVTLDDYKVRAELTTSTRVGVHRYAFPKGTDAKVLLDMRTSMYDYPGKVLWSRVRVRADGTVTGFRETRGWAPGRQLYFAMRFSRPLAGHELHNTEQDIVYKGFPPPGEKDPSQRAQIEGRQLVGTFAFGKLDAPLVVKVAISPVSEAGAIANLDAEVADFDFDRVRAQAKQEWTQALSVLDIDAPEHARRSAYTALYHTLLGPTLFMDADGQYRGSDNAVHKADGFTNYSTFSLWDTYRALHPLLTLVQPEKRNSDFVNSMLAHHEHSPYGMLPVWSFHGLEDWCMIGYHAVPVIADAYVKGIRGFDADKALKAMVETANYGPYDGIAQYRELGYVPIDEEGEAASKTLEYAFDDWTIARMAQAMGKGDIAATFDKRAANWRNAFDKDTGFMRARKRDGSFRTPFDPSASGYGTDYTEGNAWQYSWYVPQDVAGLAAAHGGSDKLLARLDEVFNAKVDPSIFEHMEDITGLIGWYAHGNEPSHHVAYLYSYAGQPWRTQARLKQIMDTQYADRPDGLAGNDDVGQMSAWYVFTALGFYPVAPGSGEYILGRPFLPKTAMRLPNGKTFTIVADGLDDRHTYVGSVSLNGKPLQRTFLRHDEILAGGELRFSMQAEPNKDWPGQGAQAPYSMSR
ncbi:TPA: GH92 family glycosyl hydrolase [Stenotrophomonas maltophilia]|uniref:GH92 family glycosyl hydrolase n=1 Tax=Stenotrophomonas maltophilia TaxID=40324 RepID=UPI000C153F2E|nr:GH92 family glycosyl hydrolase [Stenotrophomonas maltophilia]MBA0235838.1 glycoside hydrolase family 92 protein [Stenotrophomonas maltophilia]MBA0266618.1 glycoside hydrolase family 92 protein [Stenotrophomonas maltophilia]MBA0330530.1 glycoside hydrolase family 92 protein [Stenotrophomonas maltophilia]MBN5121562.1 GH92 family glycosyl hydrolase [Stenotrophomonas maltophilia]MBO3002641.1 GH92 family glycosyl hydrolase [Stenotrophomonas maltophilia]